MSMRYDEIPTHRMYDELARFWPWISPPEDYAEEAQFWKAALRAKLGPGRHRILELGVGGGHNLSHFCDEFAATAVDLSEKMLAHSRRLNPGVEHLVGDMRTLRLKRTFDAVLIHDAIDYMVCVDDLRATFVTAAEHLRPQGVFIVAPDYTQETFEDGAIYSHTTADATLSLSHVEIDFDPDPSDSTIESLMLYLIREKGAVRVEMDRHVIGLFSRQTWIDELTAVGFDVERWPTQDDDDPRQRELFVGVLRDPPHAPPPDRTEPRNGHGARTACLASGPAKEVALVWLHCTSAPWMNCGGVLKEMCGRTATPRDEVMPCTTTIQVRGYHEDRFGHVNNARYLEFLEEGRWAYLAERGPQQGFEALGVFPVVAELTIAYRRPAAAGDTVVVTTYVAETGSRKIRMHQEIHLQGDKKACCSADVTVVLVDAQTGRPAVLSEEIVQTWPDLAPARDAP